MSVNEQRLEKALFESITERLMHRESSHLPGIGTFSVRHQPGTVQNEFVSSDGELSTDDPIVVSPPTDVILFEND